MRPSTKIDTHELAILLVYVISSSIQFSLPRMLASITHEAAWISAALGSVFGFIGLLLPVFLAMRFKERSLLKNLELIAGKVFGRIFAIVLGLYFFMLIPLLLRLFSDLFTETMLRHIPIMSLMILISANVILVTSLGLEAISRSAQIFFILLFASFLVVILGSIPFMDLKRIQPLLPVGIWPVVKGALMAASYFGEGLIILWLAPFIRDRKKTILSTAAASFGAGVVFTIICFSCVAVLTSGWVERLPYPPLRIARLVAIGEFFHRFEPLFIAIWYLSVYIKVSLILLASSSALSECVGIRNYKYLLIPLWIAAAGLAQVPKDTLVLFELQSKLISLASAAAGFGIPALLLLISAFRSEGDEE